MSWISSGRNSRRRTFTVAPGLVVAAIVALLAATCLLLGPAGTSGIADATPLIGNTPPDLLNDYMLGSQSSDVGNFGQFYTQPSPGLFEGLFSTTCTPTSSSNSACSPTSPDESQALEDLQNLAIRNTLQAFDLPASDTAAVQTWGRDDALAQMFTLLDQVANTTNGGAMPPGLTTADRNGILAWLAQVIYRQAELANDYAGLEFVKWAGLNPTTYESLVQQLNFDLNTGNENQVQDENNLTKFLSAATNPVDFVTFPDPTDATQTISEGYCNYVPPTAPSGVSNYPTYTGNQFAGSDSTAPAQCFPNGCGIGCTISNLPDEPSTQDFQEWGAADAESALEGNVDYGASANQVALALGLTAIVGSVTVGTALGATLASTGALVGTTFATSISGFAAANVAGAGYASVSTASAQAAAAAANTAAEAAAGVTAASGVAAIAAGVILFVIGTTEESIQLNQQLNEPGQFESILQGGTNGYQSIGEFMQNTDAQDQLFNLFLQATLPTPLDNQACPPFPNALDSPDQCLNPPPPPVATPGTDPVFSVTPQGGNQATLQSSITLSEVGSGATTTARIVNTDASNSSPQPTNDAWFVEQKQDQDGNPFEVTYKDGTTGTEFQSLSVQYTDWAGTGETAYLLWVPSANEYEFTPESSDLSNCISNQGTCALTPTLEYQDDGQNYAAEVVSPLGASGEALTVTPTISADPREGSATTFEAHATDQPGVSVTSLQWQYEQLFTLFPVGPVNEWEPCDQIISVIFTSSPPCLSAPVDGDGAQITFPTSGVYTVVLTATDSLSSTVTDTFYVDVGDIAPTVSLSPVNNSLTDFTCSTLTAIGSPECNQTIVPIGSSTALGGSVGHAGLQDSETVSIDWGDGTSNTYVYGPNSTFSPTSLGGWPSTNPIPFDETHTYASPGSYSAVVSATDQSGAVNRQTITEDVFSPTTTTISANPNPSVYGQQVTLSATVAPSVTLPSTFTATPTGAVSFYDLTGGGMALLGTATPGADGNPPGVATFNVSSLSVASHPLEAVFAGDNDFGGSDSHLTTYDQVVNLDPTQTVLSASTNPVVHGQALTLTTTVSVPAPGVGAAAGSVKFTDGTTTLGTITLRTVGGVTSATLSTSALSVGPHTLTATYQGGDGMHAGSHGSLTVNVDTNLSGFPKSGGVFDLSKANLSGADLYGMNLAGANLKQATLADAILVNANLAGANLNQVNLSGAMLENADFANADLKQANLNGSNLSGAIMTGAIVSGVSWMNATCPDGTSAKTDGGSCIGHL